MTTQCTCPPTWASEHTQPNGHWVGCKMAPDNKPDWVEPYLCSGCRKPVLSAEDHAQHVCFRPPSAIRIGPTMAFVHGLAIGMALASLGFGLWLRSVDVVEAAATFLVLSLLSLKAHTP